MSDHDIFQLLLLPLLAALALAPSGVQAEPASKTGSISSESERGASDAQPGVHRVAIAEPTLPTLAATLGYGYTEPQAANDGSHHRLSTQLAGAFSVTPWLNLGGVTNARYDAHPNDSGEILDAALVTRVSTTVNNSRLGVELRGWVPGSEHFSSSLEALSLDTRALFAQRVGTVTLATSAGYRLDRGAKVGNLAQRYSRSDRLALGLSDFNAVLLGIGAIVPLGHTEFLMELSGDALVGKGAPSISKSPLRASTGIRQLLSNRLSADILLDFSLSGRPDIAPSAPLSPIEPRITILAGIRYRFSGSEKPIPIASVPPVAPRQPTPAPSRPVVAVPTESPLEVVVVDDLGAQVPEAKIRLSLGGTQHELDRDEAGNYRDEHAPAGAGELAIEAKGFEPTKRNIEIQGGVPQKLEIQLTALPPPSQVRGVVRSFGGKGVVAKIHVEPIGSSTTTDSSGAFQLDIPPGNYEVVIEATGYDPQHRKVQVEPSGVVILNADLVKKR